MKNFLKTTLYILAFGIAGIIFQISCSNSDNINQVQNVSQINKLIYFKNISSNLEIWTCNYDGTNQTQIPINLPANVVINNNNLGACPRLSPDGQKVFFVALNFSTNIYSIYSCDITGSNLQEILPGTSDTINLVLGSAN